MKRVLIGLLVAFLAFIGFGIAIFKFGLGNIVYNLFSDSQSVHIRRFQLLNLFGIGLFMTLSSVFGFFLSKRKNRNRLKWSVLCFFFNLWALLVLWFLPASNNDGKPRHNRMSKRMGR